MNIPKLPLAEILEQGVLWIHLNLELPFEIINTFLSNSETILRTGLLIVPPILMILILSGLGLWKLGRGGALMIFMALLFIWDLRLWKEAMETLSLVLIAAGSAVSLGIPMGILVGESRVARAIVSPILDFMQTMPSFVYLIPTVLFFGVGSVPGIIATVIFAFPPPVRLTALGLTQIDSEVIEAGEAFGCNRWELLTKIKLPLSIPSIILGVNQCIMMSLSMVVIASLIGARGLGALVVKSLSQVDIILGIEAGVSVVLIAMVLDRLSLAAISTKGSREWL